MRYWNLLIMIVFFSSCNEQNINDLKCKKIKFKDLPFEVTHYLRNPKDYHDDTSYRLIELPKGGGKNYRIEAVKTMIGPWESHKKLVDIGKDIFYKIDRGVPRPLIVFENKLYVPDRYNIFTTVDSLDSLEFIRYDLK